MTNESTVLRDLLKFAERQICSHDETHRGGAIWEICDMCGAQWADDQGGKPEFKWPAEVEAARALVFDASPTIGAALSPDYAELRKLAEAASFGDIWYGEHSKMLYASAGGDTHPLIPQDKAFIIAANPAAILSLLDALASRPAAHVSAPTEDQVDAALAVYNATWKETDSFGVCKRNGIRAVLEWAALVAPAPADSSAAPSDEQAAFEKAFAHRFSPSAREYSDELQANLNGWMARAALATQPAPVSAHVSERDAVLEECADLIATLPCQMPTGWDSVYRSVFNQGADNLRMAGTAAIRALKSQPAAPVAVSPSPVGESLSALPSMPGRDGDWAGDDWLTFDSARSYGQQCWDAALATHRQPEGGAAQAGERAEWTRQELLDEIAKLESVVEMCNTSTQKWKDAATKEASVQGVPELTEAYIAEAVRDWFPDRANQAEYFAKALATRQQHWTKRHLAAAPSAPQGESK